MLRRLQGEAVPQLLGHDGDRVLLADIPGEDQYDADEPELLAMVVDAGRAPGVVDRPRGRPPRGWACPTGAVRGSRPASPTSSNAVPRTSRRRRRDARDASSTASRPASPRSTRAASPTRSSTATSTRATSAGRRARSTILDWGDCGVGNPLLDLPAFLEGIAAGRAATGSATHWLDAWARRVPGSTRHAPPTSSGPSPPPAGRDLPAFVDNIEPVERRHHDADVLMWLRRAAAIARAG